MNDIFYLFDCKNNTELNLQKILQEIVDTCPVLKSFSDDFEENNKNYLEVCLSMKNQGINFPLIFKVYNKEYESISEIDIVEIIKSLHIIDSSYILEMLVYMKFNFPNLKVPYENLEDMYNNIIPSKNKIAIYIKNNCHRILSTIEINKKSECAIFCAEVGSLECLKLFSLEDVTKLRILRTASKYNQLNIIKYIFDTYFELKDDNKLGSRIKTDVLHISSKEGFFHIVEYILTLNAKDDKNYSLYWAIKGEHFEIVKLLIDNGSNIESENPYDCVPYLHILFRSIMKKNDMNFFKWMIDKNINQIECFNFACKYNKLDIVEKVLNKTNALNIHTGLMIATNFKSDNVSRYLIEIGAHIEFAENVDNIDGFMIVTMN